MSFEECKNLGIPEEYNIRPKLEALGFICVRHIDEIARNKRDYRDLYGPIPDFLLQDIQTGKLVYLDVKTKKQPRYYFNEESWRHGNREISSYRARAEAEGIPVIVVFYECVYNDAFQDKYFKKVSPIISIGGYWIVNVNTPYIGQEHGETNKYNGMCYYDRSTLKPLEQLREVAELDSD